MTEQAWAADRMLWHQLADCIRGNLDELAALGYERYRRDYTFSSGSNVPEDAAILWNKECFNALADELDMGTPDAQRYVSMGGDIVLQREFMLYQIDAYMEESLFLARLIAELICRIHVGNVSRINELLSALESFTQWRIRSNLASFSDMISQPMVLSSAWRLGAQQRSAMSVEASNQETKETAPSSSGVSIGAEASGMSNVLTARELRVAELVAQGKTNAEIASEFKIKLSTVKNTLSRIYAKLQVTNRVELTIALEALNA